MYREFTLKGLKPLLWLTFLLSAASAAEASDASMEPCFIDGVDEQLQCGFVSVPENYQQPDERTLRIHYAILPAVTEAKKTDPLLILAGGPGQAATELAPMITRMFKQVRKQRDILLIDQRGTGKSNALSCDIEHADELIRADDEQDLEQMARDCRQQYTHTDLTQYNTLNSIRDFEQVRRELGIQQLNLYGASYGTRVGLKYLQQFPDSVRTISLDAVAPPQVIIGPFGLNGNAAFQAMLKDCQLQSACARQFPRLGQDYQKVMTDLEKQSALLETNDPLTHQPLTLRMTAGRFSSIIRMALYSPFTRQLLPYTINQAVEQNYQPILGLMGGTTVAAQNSIYLGLMLSVVCSEDIPRADAQLFSEDADNNFIGGRTGDAFKDMCNGWVAEPVEPGWDDPVVSDKPVLLLSGTQDPVTPAKWGNLAAQTLANSRHLVAQHASHTIAGHTCANEIVAEFIKTASVTGLDDSCLQQRQLQPFVLNANGEGL
ncbi:MAG: alpha/beta hydrolase [Pseudomonadota bacterium]